jgi:hypothetical protein
MQSSASGRGDSSPPELTVVIPVFDEAPNLRALWGELEQALAEVPGSAEVIFVDDASHDDSAAIVRNLAAGDSRIRLLQLRSHAGLSAAFAAGFRAARGQFVVTLDADLQNDPRDIPRVLDALETADLAQGCRTARRDPWLKRFSSRSFNAVRNRVLRERVRDSACSLRALRRQCLDDLLLFDGFHRFLPSLCRARGWRVIEVPVHHRPRRHGQSKFGVRNRLGAAVGDLLALRALSAHHHPVEAREEPRGAEAAVGVSPLVPRSHRQPRSALALAALWMVVACVIGAWGVLARPRADVELTSGATGFTVLAARPAAPILTLRVWWEAPRGSSVSWVVLEPGHAWPATAEPYWRRRLVPGWNQLVWDDFSGFPADQPVELRVLGREGLLRLAPVGTSSGYTLAHLAPLRGLLVGVILLIAGTLGLAWRAIPHTVRAWHVALVAVAAGALGLRLYTLTSQSFWFDEVLTAIGAQSFAWVLYSPQVFGHPPLQYLVGWLFGGAHAAEGWMRAPFVGAGVAAVVAVGLLGRRMLGAPTGVLAAGLLAISPFHVELSQLARPYAFLVLGVALSWLLLFSALERGHALDWAGFSAAAAVSCYTHYLAGIALAAQAVAAATWVARRRGENGLRATVSFAGVALLLAPWAATLARFTEGQIGGGHSSAASLQEFVQGAVMPELFGSGLGAVITGALLLFGLWRVRHPEIALAVMVLLALPLAILWAANPAQALAGRYFAFVLPMLVIAVAHGLVGAARLLGRVLASILRAPTGRIRRAATAAAALVLILAGNLPARADLGEYYRWRRGADWRTVAAVLDQAVGQGDQVVATLGAVYPLRYYWHREVTEVDAQQLQTRYRAHPADRRLWIITLDGWDWAPDLHQWLDANAIEVGEVQPSWSLPRVHIHRARGAVVAASSTDAR